MLTREEMIDKIRQETYNLVQVDPYERIKDLTNEELEQEIKNFSRWESIVSWGN